jgi:hypothetical protein
MHYALLITYYVSEFKDRFDDTLLAFPPLHIERPRIILQGVAVCDHPA